ncbi:MAG: HupE/UreJ family protein, partial [Mesorhizobium sp.]
MISASTKRTALATILFLAAAMPAYAHVGVGTTSSFTTGFMHPLSGLDHMTVMIAVGLWAAMKGGKAVWAWPLAFVGVMVAGAALGMLQVPVPFVEPGILASVVALGLLVALAVDL